MPLFSTDNFFVLRMLLQRLQKTASEKRITKSSFEVTEANLKESAQTSL